MIMVETKKNWIKHNRKDILKLSVSSNKSNICYINVKILFWYFID